MKLTTDKRSSLIIKNVAFSFIIKGWSAIVVLTLVPITLKCLGEYSNGVWLTISSIMLWIDNMDIGLGNGLRNKLAVHLAHDEIDKAKSLISSTFAMLTIIMIPTMILLLLLIWFCDIYHILNVDPRHIENLNSVLAICVVMACTTFIFKLIGNFYMGLQLPAINNLLIACGQTLILLGTFIVYRNGSHSLMHITLVNTFAPLAVYLIAYPYTFWYRYPHLRPAVNLINLQEACGVIKMGVQFFVIQISGALLFMTSNVMISKLFSPAMVTPYQIVYRYFSIILVAFTVICMPFWNATTDAYERRDIPWILHASQKLQILMMALMLCLIAMVMISPWVYDVWIGEEICIDYWMSIMMAIYIFILIYSMCYSYFINGIGKLRLQMIVSVSAAQIFIPLAYIVVQASGSIISFMTVMCLVNLPGLIVNIIQFKKLINGKAKGIWNK